MTEGARRCNVVDELTRAEEVLRVAATLSAAGLYTDARSRVFFAGYHYVRALLFARGIEPKSHKGALHLFNVEFVREGSFSRTDNVLQAKLEQLRGQVDYAAAVGFGADEVGPELEAVRRFGESVVAFPGREGWSPSPGSA